MLFNSLDFAVFLPLVFLLYWILNKQSLRLQNLFILIASYVFYGWWDWRFLGLILFSTLVDFLLGKLLGKTSDFKMRNCLLLISLVVNIGLLGFFKYYNFFVESWIEAWSHLGVAMHASTLKIILPVGISFYTFQTLSYTIDVYRRQLEPTSNFIQFAAFVSFFPQLVAGPIERAKHLLPQFQIKRIFDSSYAIQGFYLIIWGLFKKVVIADTCAFFVDQIFDTASGHSSLELFMGVTLFAFQIYGDFSGYSDIAIGVARLFGFSIMTNFSFPYFSRDIAEFWRRWHISLTTWFRDYLYIPLGGSKGKIAQRIRNVFIVFIVSGFWHGANWTFIVWGLLHALLFLPLFLAKKNRTYAPHVKLSLVQAPKVVLTFFLVTIAWIFFRADNIGIANQYLIDLFSFNGYGLDIFLKSSKTILFSSIILFSIFILILFEALAVKRKQNEVVLSRFSAICILLLICFMGVFKNPSDFIYFQF